MAEEMFDDLNELEDFDLQNAKYQIWLLGYNKDQEITDFEVFINEYDDPDKAVKYAKLFLDEERYKTLIVPEDVKYIECLVETVVEIEDEADDENVATLFSEAIEL